MELAFAIVIMVTLEKIVGYAIHIFSKCFVMIHMLAVMVNKNYKDKFYFMLI